MISLTECCFKKKYKVNEKKLELSPKKFQHTEIVCVCVCVCVCETERSQKIQGERVLYYGGLAKC